MLKFIIIITVLTIMYLLLYCLMKAADKSIPQMPNIKTNGDKDIIYR